MENNEIFFTEVRNLLLKLLRGNFVDKLNHLASQGHANYAKHTLLQERYELYQDFFDKISEYMLAAYWEDDLGISEFSWKCLSDLDEETRDARAVVMHQLSIVRGLNADAALNSILDELETSLNSSKFKLGL